jgi:16S rRNA (cytosine1402-N4)-methyltransferase
MDVYPHRSVLLQEVIQAFEPVSLTVMVDGTLGLGGHAQALLETHAEIQYYVGLDQDPQALALASQRLQRWSSQLIFKQVNFVDLALVLQDLNLPRPNGILLDLGVSSLQLDQPSRGFSFMHEGPLDMRMNPDLILTAADVVNTYSEQELGRILRDYGEERHWRAAAHAIVLARQQRPLVTTTDLKNVLMPVLARYRKKKDIHPLTLVFQALRICVNRELDVLKQVLVTAIDLLAPKGRLCVISFHRLEDRLVKTAMQWAGSDKWDTAGLGGSGLFQNKTPTVQLITKKPIEPSEEEKRLNPRCRSAKLRVIEKLSTSKR